MKLSELKNHLETAEALRFILPDGSVVPSHFHITEAGLMTKNFIDCGGTIRSEKAATMQLWIDDNDLSHRLAPEKLLKILSLSDSLFGTEDLEIDVEYQTDTIGRYSLDFKEGDFLLTAKQTDCLAKDTCGISQEPSFIMAGDSQNSCIPGGGCC